MQISSERRRILTQKAQEYQVNVDQAEQYLLSRGISREVADMFGFGYVTEGQFAGRVSIPYLTPKGVVAIKYRCADQAHGEHKGDEHCPKYLYEPGCGTHLYNAQVLGQADRVVLTEGELDAVCVQAYCGVLAVAYPGVDTWQKQTHWRYCFEGIGQVIVVSDGDSVGRKAAARVAESVGMNARVLDLPDGQDANTYIATQGAGAFLALLNK